MSSTTLPTGQTLVDFSPDEAMFQDWLNATARYESATAPRDAYDQWNNPNSPASPLTGQAAKDYHDLLFAPFETGMQAMTGRYPPVEPYRQFDNPFVPRSTHGGGLAVVDTRTGKVDQVLPGTGTSDKTTSNLDPSENAALRKTYDRIAAIEMESLKPDNEDKLPLLQDELFQLYKKRDYLEGLSKSDATGITVQSPFQTSGFSPNPPAPSGFIGSKGGANEFSTGWNNPGGSYMGPAVAPADSNQQIILDAGQVTGKGRLITDKRGKQWIYFGTADDPSTDRNPSNWKAQ